MNQAVLFFKDINLAVLFKVMKKIYNILASYYDPLEHEC